MKTKEVAQMQMAVDEILEESNCRCRKNPGKFAELVQNVKKVGVLEPALVRRNAEGKVIMIAGHRRLAAAKAAGLKEIPVRLFDVDEKQAAEIQALENLHREDLSPLDEARAPEAIRLKKNGRIGSYRCGPPFHLPVICRQYDNGRIPCRTICFASSHSCSCPH